jgi:hypothetical protein
MGIDDFLEAGDDVLTAIAHETKRKESAQEKAYPKAKLFFMNFEDELRESVTDLEVLLKRIPNFPWEKIDIWRANTPQDSIYFTLKYFQQTDNLYLKIQTRRGWIDRSTAEIRSNSEYKGIFHKKKTGEKIRPISVFEDESISKSIKNLNDCSEISQIKEFMEKIYSEKLIHDYLEDEKKMETSRLYEHLKETITNLSRYFAPYLKKYIKNNREELRI